MIEVKNFVTWLKSWFYGIEQVDELLNAKANKNLGTAGKNVVTDSSGVISLEDKPTIDSSLSSTSTNAVQNKVINTSLNNKVDKVTGKGLSSNDFTSTYKSKLDDLDTNLSSKRVTVEEQSTAESGYAKTYVIKQGGNQVGSKINIPKDFLVKSASVKTVTTANTPVSGYVVGDKYLDFIVNSKDGSATDEHLYVLVSDLVDTEIEWNNILNKPSTFTPSSHTHNTGDIIDSNPYWYIGSTINATQTSINTNINKVLGEYYTELGARKVFFVEYNQLPDGISDWGYEELYIVNYQDETSNEWRIYYWDYISEPNAHFDLKYFVLSQKGDCITSIELVPKSEDNSGAIRLYYGDET